MPDFHIDRRTFLAASAAAGAAAAMHHASASAAPKRNIMKSLKYGMIAGEDANGNKLSTEDRLKIAVDAGFAGVEPGTIGDDKALADFAKAAEKTGIHVDAVVCGEHWRSPLSDANPDVAAKTMASMRRSFQNVKELGGDMVLLVPAVVNPKTSYAEAWARSVEHIKILAEDAEKAEVVIGIENVWNKFLLSPLEAVAYIDEIGSENVQFWFDVGNVVQFGYPEDWIRTLGGKIARVDVKDFKRKSNSFEKLTEGDVNWPEVMKAFDEIGYEGVFAAEVAGGDLDYLTKYVSKPMDDFIAM